VKIVDSHAHLHFASFDADRAEVLGRARAAGVVGIVNVGTDAVTSRLAFELSEREDGIFPTAGIHPNDSGAATPEDWDCVERLIRDPRCYAVGECGLDYYRDRTPKAVQLVAFERQVGLSRESGRPLIIHCREAFDDVYATLRRLGPPHSGVMHCFSGSPDQAREAVSLGLYVSFACPITYPKNEESRRALAVVPSDRVLIETDCPFLPPEGKRGKRNEPSFLPYLVHEVARVAGERPEDAALRTSANAQALFRLPIVLDGR
jgi:TatD DNase family protein